MGKKDFIIKDGLLTGYNGKGGDVIIPNDVTDIAVWAFSDMTQVTSVKIPSSVTTISEQAFIGCKGLTSVTLEGGAFIAREAFAKCRALTTVRIPCTMAYIDELAFSKCPAISEIVYEGTEREWENIEKVDGWVKTAYTLRCRKKAGPFRIVYVDFDASAALWERYVIQPEMLDMSFTSAERAKKYLATTMVFKNKRELIYQTGSDYAEKVEFCFYEKGDRVTIDEVYEDRLVTRHEYTIVKIR